VRIFKNKWFPKFARDEDISDAKLCRAVKDAENGLTDADYGGGVIKQRIARQNEGKSGGYRAIILFRRGDKSFFVYGFPKNEREDISKAEERAFKDLANITLSLSDDELETLLKQGTFKPVECHE
jgi:hypothetical protein